MAVQPKLLKKTFSYLIFLPIILSSCILQDAKPTDPISAIESVKIVELNLKEGYAAHASTGDTIQPIILSNGDTLQSGIKIKATGRIINPKDIEIPETIVLKGPPKTEKAHRNVIPILENLNVQKVKEDDLTKTLCEEFTIKNTSHSILNEFGDSVFTGYSFPLVGEILTVTPPQPHKLLEPRYKDAAIKDIQYLDVDQGLPSSHLRMITKDSKGNIWFVSEMGLCQYNGTTLCPKWIAINGFLFNFGRSK